MQQAIYNILQDPNEASRNQRMSQYLTSNKLTPNQSVALNAAGNTVEIGLSLMGLDGVVKVVKFVFQNKDTLFKVFNILKCFYSNDGKSGVFFVDGVKNMFLNLNESVYSLAAKGTINLKVLKDNIEWIRLMSYRVTDQNAFRNTKSEYYELKMADHSLLIYFCSKFSKFGDKTPKQPKCSYMPFSIGERNCPDQKFAQLQSSILFAYLFNMFDIQLEDSNYKMQFTQRFLREPLAPIRCIMTRKQ